jgi:hypothetical protein
MKRSPIFPRWFRFLLAGSFGGLLLFALVLRDGTIGATARGVFEHLVAPAAPLLNAHAMIGQSQGLPGKGAYRLNGMRVRFDTFGARQGAGRLLIEIERMMDTAGYVHRIIPVQGLPMAVGVHPDTNVMLTAMPGRDVRGNPVVRLTQQNLKDLQNDFVPELPDVPQYPGAREQTLIESLEGEPSTSLSYSAGGTPADIRTFYAEQMRQLGWRAIEAPLGPDGDRLEMIFFEKGANECSIVIARIPESADSYVLATVSGRIPEA